MGLLTLKPNIVGMHVLMYYKNVCIITLKLVRYCYVIICCACLCHAFLFLYRVRAIFVVKVYSTYIYILYQLSYISAVGFLDRVRAIYF